MEIDKYEPKVERLERFQSLQAGQYWRAKEAVPEQGVEAGEALLLQSIKWVDDAAHTIVLRAHPLKFGTDGYIETVSSDGDVKRKWVRFGEHAFLVDDFLRLFEFEPDAEAIRKREMAAVNLRAEEIRKSIDEFGVNPEMVERIVENGLAEAQSKKSASGGNLPAMSQADVAAVASVATGSVSNALALGISEQKIAILKAAANREREIVGIKSAWIDAQTEEMTRTLAKIAPFYAEKAAATRAQTEDATTWVAKLEDGLASLDLYIGKDVELYTVRQGNAAAKGEPLTLVQKKRCMDEELAVFLDVDHWFDFSKRELFFDALRENDDLVRQVFPTERCILVMATTRRHIDYGDSFTNAAKNQANRQVFLLVRNGWNIHCVSSPVESHLGASKLFPARGDGDAIFTGADGRRIKFDDLAFTEKLTHHERQALHYKRFLILIAGLDHREKLFGDFYDEKDTADFITQEFQEKYFVFLRDDDRSASLPGTGKPSVHAWIKDMNRYVQAGSRLVVNWSEVISEKTTPSAFDQRSFQGTKYQRYRPVRSVSVAIPYRNGTELFVDAEVTGTTVRGEPRSFNAKVNLDQYESGWHTVDQIPYLCIDRVTPADLHWYIHSREARTDHISFIRVFKSALREILVEREAEKETRQMMAKALRDGNVVGEPEIDTVVDNAVAAWRAANKGRELPKTTSGKLPPAQWQSLLDLMFNSARGLGQRADMAKALLAEKGMQPLRIAVGGDGRIAVYAAPLPSERDDRLEPHAWVHRIVMDFRNGKANVRTDKWAKLLTATASENTLEEWEAAKEWADLPSRFASFEAKKSTLSAFTPIRERLEPLMRTATREAFEALFAQWQETAKALGRTSKYVFNLGILLPLGIVTRGNKEVRTICIVAEQAHGVLHHIAPDDEARTRVRHAFVSGHWDRKRADREMERAIDKAPSWTLVHRDFDGKANPVAFVDTMRPNYSEIRAIDSADPLFAPAFADWFRRDRERPHWFAEGVLDDDGTLMIDDLLSLKRPEGYGPYYVVRVSARDKNGHFHRFGRWIDVAKDKSVLGRFPSEFLPKDWKDREVSWSSSQSVVATLEQAQETLAREAKADGFSLKHHSELPEAPQPSEGTERWFLVEPASLANDDE